MPRFEVEGCLVVQQHVTITIEADTIDVARAIVTERAYDLSWIADKANFEADPGDGWLEPDTLQEIT